MRKLKLEITATVVFDYDPSRYPEGMSPEEALGLELEHAADEPEEYLAMPHVVTQVSGAVLNASATAPQLAALLVQDAAANEHSDQSDQLRQLQEESVRMHDALEAIHEVAKPQSADPFRTLGAIDAQAQMALVKASISRSLARTKGEQAGQRDANAHAGARATSG